MSLICTTFMAATQIQDCLKYINWSMSGRMSSRLLSVGCQRVADFDDRVFKDFHGDRKVTDK